MFVEYSPRDPGNPRAHQCRFASLVLDVLRRRNHDPARLFLPARLSMKSKDRSLIFGLCFCNTLVMAAVNNGLAMVNVTNRPPHCGAAYSDQISLSPLPSSSVNFLVRRGNLARIYYLLGPCERPASLASDTERGTCFVAREVQSVLGAPLECSDRIWVA